MFEIVIQSIFSAAFLGSILRVTTPILLPSLGALISDRAGVINIGLEGTMLGSAFTGVMFSSFALLWFGPEVGQIIGPWLGLLMGLIIAVLMSLLLAFFHLKLKANLILSGIALNILGSAGTVAIMFELTGDRGNTSMLDSLVIPFVQLPEFIKDIPLVGLFIFKILNNQSVMTWIAFLAVFLVAFMLFRTPFGIHLRAVGENPEAAASVGIPVHRTQYIALMISGLLAGLGGIHMSMGYLSFFQRDMTTGRGFIALATPFLGGNNPYGTMAASVVFGFFDALANRIGSLKIPSQLPQMIPYVATVMALVVYSLQKRQNQRMKVLRAAKAGEFTCESWLILKRLSILHVFQSMIAVIGIIIVISLFAAPNGFGGSEVAYPWATIIGVSSIAIILMNLTFIQRVENILKRKWLSAFATLISLGLYLFLFLSLLITLIPALIFALLSSALVWFLLGGFKLKNFEKKSLVN